MHAILLFVMNIYFVSHSPLFKDLLIFLLVFLTFRQMIIFAALQN